MKLWGRKTTGGTAGTGRGKRKEMREKKGCLGSLTALLAIQVIIAYGDDLSTVQLDRPIRMTTNGPVRGYWYVDDNETMAEIYEGIPYAQPPIGQKRFEVWVWIFLCYLYDRCPIQEWIWVFFVLISINLYDRCQIRGWIWVFLCYYQSISILDTRFEVESGFFFC